MEDPGPFTCIYLSGFSYTRLGERHGHKGFPNQSTDPGESCPSGKPVYTPSALCPDHTTSPPQRREPDVNGATQRRNAATQASVSTLVMNFCGVRPGVRDDSVVGDEQKGYKKYDDTICITRHIYIYIYNSRMNGGVVIVIGDHSPPIEK